eukprot:10322049-Alexandrium_andersonii.AAC.1
MCMRVSKACGLEASGAPVCQRPCRAMLGEDVRTRKHTPQQTRVRSQHAWMDEAAIPAHVGGRGRYPAGPCVDEAAIPAR